MPGIAGIISAKPTVECEQLVEAMVGTMKHQSFYTAGTLSVSELGVYAGWVAMKESKQGVLRNVERDVVIVFAGECFPGSAEKEEASYDEASGEDGGRHWLMTLYENRGIRFVEMLNGLFSGLLIDRRRRSAFLFNDRYGVERLYWAETQDSFFFASEAKAILRVCPKTRAFDDEGVAQFLTLGCTLPYRTLFHGVELLPGGSLWTFDDRGCRKQKYFSAEMWESQTPLSKGEFQIQLRQVMERILPRYFASEAKIGISLTGGLDTRMIMACRPLKSQNPVCFTYSGQHVDTLDARIAARVAAACGLEHHSLRIGSDFFSDFHAIVDETVFMTDGYSGVTGAHEVYMNRKARLLAPVRLTGNYGGEILRGVSTFKPVPLDKALINPQLHASMEASLRELADLKRQQKTFAAFCEVPFNLFGNLMAGRSQLTFRTPYLDNELVALASRAPDSMRRSRYPAVRLIKDAGPALASIPTDRGFLGHYSAAATLVRRFFLEATFKLDYINNEGFPHRLSRFDAIFEGAGSRMGLLGLHKHLRYRSWFRRELAEYIQQALGRSHAQRNLYWICSMTEGLARSHTNGVKNHTFEINAVLTLEAIDRLLLRGLGGRLPVSDHLQGNRLQSERR